MESHTDFALSHSGYIFSSLRLFILTGWPRRRSIMALPIDALMAALSQDRPKVGPPVQHKTRYSSADLIAITISTTGDLVM